MSLVVDANLIAALILPLPYSNAAALHAAAWKRNGEVFYAPYLMQYEITSVLRRAIVDKFINSARAESAIRQIFNLHIDYFAPTEQLHTRALYWAERLGHSKAYDAYYLALAEQERVDFWSADRRLVNGARQAGVTWVYSIED